MTTPASQFEFYKGRMGAFCEALDFKPDHYQSHFLKRIVDMGPEGTRIGMTCDLAVSVETMVAGMLYRALVDHVTTFMWFETKEAADIWLDAAILVMNGSKIRLRHYLAVPTSREYLNAGGRRTCVKIGPFSNEIFSPGKQDILLPELDATPGERVLRACKLTAGSILYIPCTPHGPLAQRKHG